LDKKRGTIDLDLVQDGVPFSSRVVSEGTLRALALCALAANPWPASLVAYEEPENGVHPRRIETIGELLAQMVREARKQVIVSTHSPRFAAVMAEMGREGPFAGRIRLLRVQQVGRQTEIHPLDASTPLIAHGGIESSLRDDGEERRGDSPTFEEVYARGWLDA
ncbi:MAG: AAA family ATPase, partial [Myxococcota bacterium]